MEVNAVWLIWLILVPILLAALFAAWMVPVARGNRTAALVGDILMIAIGVLSIPPRYLGLSWW